MKQKLEFIEDLARKIMLKNTNLFRYEIEPKESTVVIRFFDAKNNEIYGMQGVYSDMVTICNFILKNNR